MLSSPRRKGARSWLLTVALALGLGAIGALVPLAHAQEVPAEGLIVLRVGEAESIADAGVDRIAIGDPAVADARPGGQDTVRVLGVSEGKTTLLVWNQAGERSAFVIDVRR